MTRYKLVQKIIRDYAVMVNGVPYISTGSLHSIIEAIENHYANTKEAVK